ncbi:MAG: hypothetical protein L0G69_13015, partial [Brevibacterium sp.]|nr:hypothetical protein [Brevibacterium sp.]
HRHRDLHHSRVHRPSREHRHKDLHHLSARTMIGFVLVRSSPVLARRGRGPSRHLVRSLSRG